MAQPALTLSPRALRRDANVHAAETAESFGLAGSLSFICECRIPGCREELRLPPADFWALSARRNVFMVVPGHRGPADRVRELRFGFVLVEGPREARYEHPAGLRSLLPLLG